MIPVNRCDEPVDFDAKVRKVGMRWLHEKLGGARAARPGRPVESVVALRASELEDYWTRALPDLCRLYGGVCAYAGLEILENGHSVDHFEPKGNCLADPSRRHLIYEWNNYRYAFKDINGAKGEKRVLDPFTIGANWFELEFVGLTVFPRCGLEESLRPRVNDTIRDLGLNAPWLCRLRTVYFEEWNAGYLRIEYLRRHAPFVACEIERQQLTPEFTVGLM